MACFSLSKCATKSVLTRVISVVGGTPPSVRPGCAACCRAEGTRLTATPAPAHSSDWPGPAQGRDLGRHTHTTSAVVPQKTEHDRWRRRVGKLGRQSRLCRVVSVASPPPRRSRRASPPLRRLLRESGSPSGPIWQSSSTGGRRNGGPARRGRRAVAFS